MKARQASKGPWIDRDSLQAFLRFCEQHGKATRSHRGDMMKPAVPQVQHQGHWMGLTWNASFKRYTADRRLSLLVQSFAALQAPADGAGGEQ